MTGIPADAEEQFQRYLELNKPYVAAIEAEGDTPWHDGEIERRRTLYFRRWNPPARNNH